MNASEFSDPPGRPSIASRPLLVSGALVAGAVAFGRLIQQFVRVPDLSLVFLTVVLVSAIKFGSRPSLFTAAISVVAYNFFFLPPVLTFTVADRANVFSLAWFFVVALITGALAAQLRRQARGVAQRSRVTAELFAFSRKVVGVNALDELVSLVTLQLTAMLNLDAVILLPDEERELTIGAGTFPPAGFTDLDMAAARWAWRSDHVAGRGSDTLTGAKWLFLPVRTARSALALAGVSRASGVPPTADERLLLDALLDQAAVAIERIRFAQDIDRVRLQAETERLRNAMLTSISHDLRTPLASIIGGVTSLRGADGLYDSAQRDVLLTTVQDEAERLNRFIGNLLDITRLDSGGLQAKDEIIDLGEIIAAVLGRTARLMQDHRLEVRAALVPPLVQADFALLEQVLFNLLDNAAKYTPARTVVAITTRRRVGSAVIEVVDEGPGLPEDSLEAVFNKFARLRVGDRQRAGTGLGLAIARGFVTAMGGTLTAGNRHDRSGAVFAITLPLAVVSGEARELERAHAG